MKAGFYSKLAWDGIRKNKKFYLPYILTCIGVVFMFYIIRYLAVMPALESMHGGSEVKMTLGFGSWIVALFAVIFLFYTNSFLMRRRQKEYGLYNILGMGKGHLSVLLFWENAILLIIVMLGGLLGGILLSKMAELCLIMILDGKITYNLTINKEALIDTWLIFVPIFAVIFLKSLIQLKRLSAVALLKSEQVGEKPPKANYFFGVVSVLILAAAYYISLSIESPLIALEWFFIAVAMVIVATYLLFISGSVMLCKILQKNKRYYYKKSHFVSVSSMSYRMKRNGASLASICILSTIVLVTMMGAGSLYFGKEDSLNTRYPRDIAISVDFLSEDGEKSYTHEKEDFIFQQIDEVLNGYGVEPENTERFLSTSAVGMLKNGKLILNPNQVNGVNIETMENVATVYLIPLDSYNKCMNTQESLADDEVIIHCVRRTYDDAAIELSDGTVWKVKKQVDKMMGSGNAAMDIIPSLFVVVPNINNAIKSFNSELKNISEASRCRLRLVYEFDTDLTAKKQISLSKDIRESMKKIDISGEGGFYSYGIECRESERADFYGLFGGVFFLGIFLSIIFLAATVLIIYYKQITEGYEDEARFGIMRKVGMTAKDIRKSINSQMLTVFFMPMVTAVLHVGFAFPVVQKILMMFNLRNTTLSLCVTAATIVVFGIFYAVVYKITSNAYYSIVSGRRD